jgi:hypothetical protein
MIIEIYFSDLNKEKQKDIIDVIDENATSDLVPLAILDIEED